MKYNVYQEVTIWDKHPNIPNHRYIFNENRQLVGYYPQGSTERQMFVKPINAWSSSRRKLKKIYSFEE